jgi:hypothetical protein
MFEVIEPNPYMATEVKLAHLEWPGLAHCGFEGRAPSPHRDIARLCLCGLDTSGVTSIPFTTLYAIADASESDWFRKAVNSYGCALRSSGAPRCLRKNAA